MLSRERVTVYTQVTSDSQFVTPEFIFMGKGTRTKVNVANDIHFQWSPSGSYWLEHMLKTISHLPNRFNPFTQKNYAIYVIDDYAVNLMPEIRKALFQRGYILVVMGGGITGFIQANDTHYHRKLKSYYRDLEMELMLEKLQVERNKVPRPTREEMVNMTVKAAKKIDVNFSEVFKQLFVTNDLNGSEDYLVSDKLFDLIGEEMKDFPKTLLDSNTPNTIQELIRPIIPPKGMRRKNIEGVKLLDFSVEEVSFEPEEPDDVDPISEE